MFNPPFFSIAPLSRLLLCLRSQFRSLSGSFSPQGLWGDVWLPGWMEQGRGPNCSLLRMISVLYLTLAMRARRDASNPELSRSSGAWTGSLLIGLTFLSCCSFFLFVLMSSSLCFHVLQALRGNRGSHMCSSRFSNSKALPLLFMPLNKQFVSPEWACTIETSSFYCITALLALLLFCDISLCFYKREHVPDSGNIVYIAQKWIWVT